MVTKKEIQKVIDPRARWIARDRNGEVRWFVNKPKSAYYVGWILDGLGCSKSTINKYWRNWGVNGRLRSDKEIADE